MRHKPLVVVCFESHQQRGRYGISHETRVEETGRAMDVLGCQWDQLPIADHTDEASLMQSRILLLACMEELRDSGRFSKVFAPAGEHNGHEGHNLVATCATQVFGEVTRYMTYARGGGRSRSRTEVRPERLWPALKLQAMACHASQVNLMDTRPWFGGEWWREWTS